MSAQLNKARARSFASASLVFSCVALLATAARPAEPFSDDNWISLGGSPGANNQVNASVVDAAGNLYIGGSFTRVGETKANFIAKWDGNRWSALGSGLTGGGLGNILIPAGVRALAVSGSDLYAAGHFTTAGGGAANFIAKWNGSSWSALGSGLNSNVFALAVSGNDLYAGGAFTTAGGGAATNIAKWDGNSWSALGSGVNGWVNALAVSGSDLYAGGQFASAGGVPANGIAKWNGSSWSALGLVGGGSGVTALAVSGSDLYAGGYGIAKWDGSSWSPLGSGVELGSGFVGRVNALAVSGSDLYAGGAFTTAGGVTVNGIAKWSGSSWSALGSGMTAVGAGGAGGPGSAGGNVRALAVSGAGLYAGGAFTTAGGRAANDIAKWDGTNWSALASEVLSALNDFVYALAVSRSDLYAGGQFTMAGGVAANHIARWNGSSWIALGSGMNSNVYALTASGSDLYAVGLFTTAGGVPANGIARWNGSSWSALGSGMNGWVNALAVSGSDLYAGGSFTTAGGVGATNIAKWNGSSWSALGSGLDDGVRALAVSGSDLYVGGFFSTAGGVPANGIAKWNGSSWSALGLGGGSRVGSLAVSGSDLYAAGYFPSVGPANIAKWDGSSWTPLSGVTCEGGGESDCSAQVVALAVSGSDLYAAGVFNRAGGMAVNDIAKWDGSSWSALGSGVGGYLFYNRDVLALAVSETGSDLYAGGTFTLAGDKAAGYAARAILRLPSLSLRRATSSTVAVSWPSASTGFVLQQNTDGLGSGNWSNVTDPVLDDGTNNVMTQPIGTSRFFRLVPH